MAAEVTALAAGLGTVMGNRLGRTPSEPRARRQTCSKGGADDGIRTRDPNLGKVDRDLSPCWSREERAGHDGCWCWSEDQAQVARWEFDGQE